MNRLYEWSSLWIGSVGSFAVNVFPQSGEEYHLVMKFVLTSKVHKDNIYTCKIPQQRMVFENFNFISSSQFYLKFSRL